MPAINVKVRLKLVATSCTGSWQMIAIAVREFLQLIVAATAVTCYEPMA